MTRLAARALLAVVFWPSLFFFWFLGPFVFFLLSTTSSEVCPRLETRAEFLAAANGALPMLVLQNLIYAVPIICLLLWTRLLPDNTRTGQVVICIKLFALAAVLGALWEYGSSLVCDGYGQPFFSPAWRMTSYLPIANLAVNLPLYVLVFSLGRAFSMREDEPTDDAIHHDENAL
ncbi:hypothetical protein FJ934_10365 [Mesorhizobium sp. B2-4-12]|uniref:hypothetical protein n=1 Tax=unclassified Mesorhizobium TaxID=325217 RepID=UPI00112D9CD0|nr:MULTISPECIES: hypothetical protein [unclassified Mesorhizobium]TPK72628.1 hypothetical protein FJ548_28590 [Mesorhizobium sp. B2-4-17]TPK95921.1 hypothetical protein FJ934_10365 [Mesorhizobium sp. B2-4-12]TPL08825.1 hypothetical protein FJ938_07545 [Mesorhizobium sp. B2-4-14]